jgi:hypothetical protein
LGEIIRLGRPEHPRTNYVEDQKTEFKLRGRPPSAHRLIKAKRWLHIRI